jgi:transposase InsO family protein
MGVSASAYYQRRTGERSARSVQDERLIARIGEVHSENFECYGYPRVWHELRRHGEQVGRDHVARLMRREGIRGAKRRGKPWRTTIPDPAAQKRPDLVNRDFTATAPDRLWVGDLTYLRTWEGRMYFAFLIDVFSRMIVGWQLATHMRTDLVLDALRMALGTRQPGADLKLVCHTDQGSQYVSQDYTQVLDDHLVLASVGTVGDCYDNALSESFVDSYKTEVVRDRVWQTHAQLEFATVRYVGWFNHRRLHSSIGNRPPVEHEREYWARDALGFGPFPAQAAPTVTDLRDVLTVASPTYRSELSL